MNFLWELTNLEFLNDPRYEYDYEEVKNIKQKNSVLQGEFDKWVGVINDDNLKSLFKMIKSNYDAHLKECLENAERSLTTITKIKLSLEAPINEMLKRLSQQEFNFTAEFQKQQLEIDEQRQLIDKLTSEIASLKSLQKNSSEKPKVEKRLIKELRVVNKENKQMKETIQEFKDEVDCL